MASSTITKSLASDINTINASLEAINAIFENDTSTDITDLDNVPIPCISRRALAAGVSPTGARLVGNLIAMGTSSYRTIQFTANVQGTGIVTFMVMKNGGTTWNSWVKVTTQSV